MLAMPDDRGSLMLIALARILRHPIFGPEIDAPPEGLARPSDRAIARVLTWLASCSCPPASDRADEVSQTSGDYDDPQPFRAPESRQKRRACRR